MSNIKNAFIFWIGDDNKIKDLKESIAKKGYTPIVGPSKDEHNYLYSNYEFYRKSYDLKIWAYCADVWRVYILSKNHGLYIDASVKIGDNFWEFYQKISSKDYYLVRERKSILSNAVLGSFGDGNFYSEVLNVYKRFDKYDPRVYMIGPFIISSVAKKYFQYSDSWEEFNSSNILIDIFPSIRDKTTIFKFGFRSWSIKNKSSLKSDEFIDTFIGTEKLWYERKIPYADKYKYIHAQEDLYSPCIWHIRFLVEANELSVKEAKELISQIKYKIFLKERFIWTRLYMLFKRKKK